MALFRKSSKQSPVDVVDVDASGKGRPTPSRKQAELERKERLKASSSGESGRKSRAPRTSTTKADRAETRKRIIAGDESVLAARDRGPEKRYARDIVDGRHTVGEYFLYIAIFILVLGLIRVGPIAIVSQVLLVVAVGALIVDSVRTYRGVPRQVLEKYPNANVDGLARYAMMRAMVTRRMRVPGPQVKRGKRGAST